MKSTADVIICGAGIAGISAAYHLAVRHGIRDILLVDERAPLSLTSDKSTECYRNWWPGPGDAMVALMNHSIDLMEDLAHQSGNIFRMNRRGYLYVTSQPERIDEFRVAAGEPPTLGAGELRIHDGRTEGLAYLPAPAEGFEGQPTGADLFLDQRQIREYFPYLSKEVVAALHVRRAGWFSAQQLGMYLLQQARAHGVHFINQRITHIDVSRGKVEGVRLANGDVLATRNFVNASGPFLAEISRLFGVDLPVYNELHLKVAFRDVQKIVSRNAPLLIWTDPQFILWSSEEKELLQDEELQWLLEKLPAGVHTRPEGGSDSDILLMLWEYRLQESEPIWPPPLDEQYPELVLRGLTTMIPGLKVYHQRAPRPILDGGYYTKSRDNRPIIGPLPVGGANVIGALSGYGLMASCAAGELLAAHLLGTPLPAYAPAFSPDRFQDPAYLRLLSEWGETGQL